MSRRQWGILLLVVPLCFAASYYVRYAVIEEASWVALCQQQAASWICQLRSELGVWLYFQVLAWLALLCVVLAWLLPRTLGWWIGLLALLFAIPGVVLYSASLAAIALVLATLRLVRVAGLRAV